jgi:hypothetical protein
MVLIITIFVKCNYLPKLIKAYTTKISALTIRHVRSPLWLGVMVAETGARWRPRKES